MKVELGKLAIDCKTAFCAKVQFLGDSPRFIKSKHLGKQFKLCSWYIIAKKAGMEESAIQTHRLVLCINISTT